jgi:hypothetical protein
MNNFHPVFHPRRRERDNPPCRGRFAASILNCLSCDPRMANDTGIPRRPCAEMREGSSNRPLTRILNVANGTTMNLCCAFRRYCAVMKIFGHHSNAVSMRPDQELWNRSSDNDRPDGGTCPVSRKTGPYEGARERFSLMLLAERFYVDLNRLLARLLASAEILT